MTIDKILLNVLKMLGMAFSILTKKDTGVRNRSGGSALQNNPAVRAVVFICITTLVVSVSSSVYVLYSPEPTLPDSSYQALYEKSIKQNEAYTSKVETLMSVNSKLKEAMLGLQGNYKEVSKRYEDNVNTTIKISQQLNEAKDLYFDEVKRSSTLEVQLRAMEIQYQRLKQVTLSGLSSDTLPAETFIKMDDGVKVNTESSKALRDFINDIKEGT